MYYVQCKMIMSLSCCIPRLWNNETLLAGLNRTFWKPDPKLTPVLFPHASSLIFLGPSIEPLGFWEVLWTVGVTNFIIKFLMMGTKCLILLPPSSLLSFRSQVESGSKPTHHQRKHSKWHLVAQSKEWTIAEGSLFIWSVLTRTWTTELWKT